MAAFTRAQLFEAEFRKIIEAEIERLVEEMSLGAIKSFEDYRFYCGKVSALRSTLDYIEDATAITSKKLS